MSERETSIDVPREPLPTEPTPELYESYVAYWTANNNAAIFEKYPDASMTILSYEDFARKWANTAPAMQRSMFEQYQDGYERTHEKDLQLAENSLSRYKQNPEERLRVQAEVEAAIGKALRR